MEKVNNNVEIYKTYVETIENVSKRRATTHTLFLTINLAFLSVLTILLTKQEIPNIGKIILLLSSSVGILVNVCYIMLLCRYKSINKMKYDILLEIEKKLEVRPFHMEDKHKKKNLSKLGYLIPALFIILYVVLLAFMIVCLY